MFSFRETVLGIEKPVVAGELLSAGNGNHRTGAGSLLAGPLPSTLDTPMPSICRSTARKHRYSFAAYFV